MKKQYLKFKNKGEITAEAIVLLGASSKRADKSKIGFFGSGNKFALAYLLRNGYNVNIFGGEKEILIETKEHSLGKDSFNVIYIDNKQTSITTEFGAKWKLWQALREVYSNCLDEGDATIEIVSELKPFENESHWYIEMRSELMDWFMNFNNYFSENKEVLFECKYGKILRKHNDKANIYRKGIKVYETDKKSIFDYDLNNIEITEDRIIKYVWNLGEKIWSIIYSCKDKEILRKVFENVSDSYLIENSSSEYASIDSKDISDECKEVLSKMRLCNANMSGYLNEEEVLSTNLIPTKVFKSFSHLLNDENLGESFKVGIDGVMYRQFEFSPIQKASLLKVESFLNEANCLNLMEYEIVGGIFENKDITGYADKKNEKIVISDIGIDKGCNYILEVIIEEYIHLKYDAKDNTRKFQNSCIQEMVKIMKIKNAFTL